MAQTVKALRSMGEPDWRLLAERASRENNHTKLVELVHALCDRLEQLQRPQRSQVASDLPASDS